MLIAVAGFIALFGFLRRKFDDGWHGFLVFGLTSGLVSLVLGGELELKFSGDVSTRIPPAELLRYAVEANVDARWFVGHDANNRGRIDEVFSRLHRFAGRRRQASPSGSSFPLRAHW